MPTQPLLPGSDRIPEGLPPMVAADWPEAVRTFVTALARAITGILSMFRVGLTLGTGGHGTRSGHFDGQWLEVKTVFNVQTNLFEAVVPHGLGRIPYGFLTVDAVIDDGSTGPEPLLRRNPLQGWTTSVVYFRQDINNTAPCTYRILLLVAPRA